MQCVPPVTSSGHMLWDCPGVPVREAVRAQTQPWCRAPRPYCAASAWLGLLGHSGGCTGLSATPTPALSDTGSSEGLGVRRREFPKCRLRVHSLSCVFSGTSSLCGLFFPAGDWPHLHGDNHDLCQALSPCPIPPSLVSLLAL